MAVVTLRMFAGAREAAGAGRATFEGNSVREVLDAARVAYGPQFAQVLDASRVWINGDAVEGETSLADGDEIAVLPPVSGGR